MPRGRALHDSPQPFVGRGQPVVRSPGRCLPGRELFDPRLGSRETRLPRHGRVSHNP